MKRKRNAHTVIGSETCGKEDVWEYLSTWESKGGMVRHGLALYGTGQRQLARGCKHENEPSDMIKCGEYIVLLRIIKKDYLPSRYLLGQQSTFM
jgi:hypothetical protein